jgi:hypothetical protein
MNAMRRVRIAIFFLHIMAPSHGRGWSTCNESVNCCPFRQKPPRSQGKRADVIPLGYPYGNDRSSRPYLAPFAHASPYEFGEPFTFGYVAVESTPVRQRKGTKICDQSGASEREKL